MGLKKVEEVVVIVGAGQSGLAAAACLAARNVPSLILERDDCVGSLWRKRCYDRVHLHLAKQYSELPMAPHPPAAPTYLPKADYIRYLEDYAARFRLRISFRREVVAAEYDEASSRWRVTARNLDKEEEEAVEEYTAIYLVVASGENDEVFVPEIPGMEGFVGPVVHASQYRSGSAYKGSDVLVVGSGNSGMEIAYDLAECGARPSIVVRRKLHIVSRDIWLVATVLLKYLPSSAVDALVLLLCYMKFGDTSRYGFHRPSEGPIRMKKRDPPTYPIVDIGTVKLVKSGDIQVLPSVKSIKGNYVTFSDGRFQHFDAIILATGYRSVVKKWLKGDEYLIGEDGMAKQEFPNHWKGRDGLYCAGLARRGIPGSGTDGESIAKDISSNYQTLRSNCVIK